MFEVGKTYKHIAEREERECWGVRDNGKFGWLSSATRSSGVLWTWSDEWTELKRPLVDGWVILYKGFSITDGPFPSKEEAQEYAIDDDLTVVHVRSVEDEQ